MKNSLGFPPMPRHNISAALQRLIRSFAQLFALEREDEVEMEIGLPTDVQHVSHIGMDVKGIGTLNNWVGDSELLSLSVPALTVEENDRVLAQTSDAIVGNGSLGNWS
ncbi:CRIB domain-containing protein RIC4-like [Zingiber officinale]|uniref:CRIB domain-containing protein n=1 Tax=Zingiber officinale TaxID=94328 RepID=A0A8J5H067_ZINOF|nr:CRIB domain-containing protein RIC4-like [Zingiber officinale]KAG6510769.1 hypothetical protein ZIOFF_028805 [Zingiber officinale]